MRLLGCFKRARETEDPHVEESLKPWAQQKITTLLANDVIEFLTETAKSIRIPISSIIDMAVRRFKKDLEDSIRSQEVEVPESIIYNLKRSEVMSRFLEENSQLIMEHEPKQSQNQEREEVE